MARDDLGNLVASIGIDATEFKTGITQINREMKVLKSEFQATQATLGPLASSMDGLRAKSDNLTRQIELQQQKVQRLAEVHQKSVKEKGNDAKATQDLAIRLNKATAYLGELENELAKTQEEMRKLDEQTKKTGINFEKLGEGISNVGKKISDVGKGWSIAITAPLALLGKKSLEAAQDVVESENLFEVALGGMANQARKFSEELNESLGLNQYTVRNNIAVLYDMSKAMGVTSQQAYDISTNLTKLAYDLASFKNLKPEEAFEKLQAGLSGESEPLKRLGYVINETTVKAYAYKAGIAAVGEELTESQKVLARYGLIMEQTQNAQGDLARTLESPANQARIARERFNELQVEIGQRLIPIFNQLLSIGNNVLDWFEGLTDAQKDSIVQTGLVVAAIGPLLVALGKVVQAIGAITKTLPALKAGLIAIGSNPVVLGIAAVAAAIGGIAIAANTATQEARDMAKALIDAANKEAEAATKTVENKYNSRIDSLQKELMAEESASQKRIQTLEKEYNARIEGARKAEQAAKKSIQEQQRALDEAHRRTIEQIRAEYGVVEEVAESKTDVVKRQAEEEIELAEKVYDKKVELLEKEYAERIKMLDEETRRQIEELQGQIDAIDEQTKEEDRIRKEQKDRERERELRRRIEQEEDAERRKQLEQELADLIYERNREKILAQREAEKEALRERMKEIEEAAEETKTKLEEELEHRKIQLAEQFELEKKQIEERRDKEIAAIQEERKAKEEAENAKYEAAKKRLEQEEAALDGYASRVSSKLQEELQQKKRIEEEKLAAVRQRIENEIAEINRLKEAELSAIEERKQARIKAAREAEQSFQNSVLYKFLTGGYITDENKLSGKTNIPGVKQFFELNESVGSLVNKAKKSLLDVFVPGRATGDTNWRGGLVMVHEKGGEILNLPRGTQIIPHDISIEMARSAGAALASELAAAIPSGQSTIIVPLYLDGRKVAEAVAPHQYNMNQQRSRGRGIR